MIQLQIRKPKTRSSLQARVCLSQKHFLTLLRMVLWVKKRDLENLCWQKEPTVLKRKLFVVTILILLHTIQHSCLQHST